MKVWTEKEIVTWIETAQSTELHRPLRRLYDRQTQDEKLCASTVHSNGIGFSASDAEFGTGLMNHWTEKGWFSDKQVKRLRRLLKKYRRQLVAVANEQETAQCPVAA